MSAESVRIMCPNLVCRRILAVPQAARGKTVRCKNCGTNIKIPVKGEVVREQPESADDKKKAG